MNIVNSGSRYQVYGEDVRTYRELPVGSYDVQFQKMSGFYLASRNDLVVSEKKIYGSSESKVEKVIHSYHLVERNFGVILSGQKGIGKSLFVRILAQRAIAEGLPVIIVSEAVPGISGFLSSIEQDCVVVFDEFEKTFAKTENWNPQDEMLSLFDGIDGGHKLFVVTCNDVFKLNECMINRPGRFHYHFTMSAPTADDIREYLKDSLHEKYHDVIEEIVSMSALIDLPYDYLRAIAFEINQGYSIKEAMSDLNITSPRNLRFDIKAYRKDGSTLEAWNEGIDMTDQNYSRWIYLKSRDSNKEFGVCIRPGLAKIIDGKYVISDAIESEIYEEDDFCNLPEDERAAAAAEANRNSVEYIVLTKCIDMPVKRLMV